MDRKAPLIFGYTNFRAYLRDAYTMRKSLDRKFSHRYINAKLGAKSSGWFSDVVTNRLGMKSKYIRPIASLFGLKENETEYLRLLVELDQSDSLKDKTVALGKIMAFKGVKAESVVAAQFEFYEDWYHSALRELLLLIPFEGDFEALAKTLQPPILPKQARKSLLLMAKLGLVAQTPSGRWKPTTPIVVKDSTLNSIHWALIQKAFIRLSLSAVERYGKEERDISALTLNFSPEGFKQASEEIAGLRKRLLALSEQDRPRNRV
jgi:uncharacterized protein (TIGR02147 family)